MSDDVSKPRRGQWDFLRDASIIVAALVMVSTIVTQFASEDVERCRIATEYLASPHDDPAMNAFYRELALANC